MTPHSQAALHKAQGQSGYCDFLVKAMQIGEEMIHTENVFSRYPGSILFFVELYRRTENSKYLSIIENGPDQLLQHHTKGHSTNYSFYDGYMRTAFVYLQLYKCMHREYYIREALKIAKDCTGVYLHDPYATSSLFYGRAGALIVLLHLHQETRERFLLQAINLFIKRIIQDIELQKEGLAAGLTGQNIKSPLGLAAGTSGLAYVFLELGYYFCNETFLYVARQLFAYENQYWDQERKCWPDFRREISDEHDFLLHRKNFLEGDLRFFMEPAYNFSIAHGLAGMGIARVRAFQLTGEAHYLDEINNCVEQLSRYYQAGGPSPLPDNVADAGMFFLEAHRVLKDKRLLNLAYRATEKADSETNEFEIHRRNTALPGFCSGPAGMGYLYLQLTDPAGTLPAVIPRLTTPCKRPHDMGVYPFIPVTTPAVVKMILQRSFTKTMYVVEQIAPQVLKNYFALQCDGVIPGSFSRLVEDLIPVLAKREQAILTDVYEIELAKIDLCNGINSGALLHIQEMFLQEAVNDLLAMEPASLLNQLLTVTSGWVTRECCFYQQLNNLYVELTDYAFDESRKVFIILKPTVKKDAVEELRVIEKLSSLRTNHSCVQEITVSHLDIQLLHIFSKPTSIGRAVDQLASIVRVAGNTALLQAVPEPPVTQYSRFMPCNPVVLPVELSLDSIENVILEKIKTFLNLHILKAL